MNSLSLHPRENDQFRNEGYCIVKNLLENKELEQLRQDTSCYLAPFEKEKRIRSKDHFYRQHKLTKTLAPFRVEYIIDKLTSCAALLAHPKLLQGIESLQGPDFIPTWDSLIFRLPKAGVGHAWHRDWMPYRAKSINNLVAAIDVGIYLDDTDETNCLWVIPGSHSWDWEKAETITLGKRSQIFPHPQAIPVPVKAGDAIFHNVMTIHGSPEDRGKLRRVVYFEFRQKSALLESGPHRKQYIPKKLEILRQCQKLRQNPETKHPPLRVPHYWYLRPDVLIHWCQTKYRHYVNRGQLVLRQTNY